MHYRFILFLIVLILSTGESIAQTESVSLHDCIRIAIANNPQLKQSELHLKQNDIRYKQSKNNLLPDLNGSVSHGISTGRNVDRTTNLFVEETVNSGGMGLNSGLTLFNGFRMFHQIRMQSSAREAGKLEFDGAINDLKLDVITAYIQVLTAQDMLVQSRKQFEVIKERFRTAEAMYKEGAFSPSDFYDLKGEYSANENAIDLTAQTLYNSKLRLASLLNIGVEQLKALKKIEIPAETDTYSADDLFLSAQQHLPQYQAWRWRQKEAETNVKMAKSEYFPNLQFGAGLSTNYSSMNTAAYFAQSKNNLGRFMSLGLSVPIFNKFSVKSNTQLARINLENVGRQEEVALNQLRENTAKAVFDLGTVKKSVKSLQEQEVNYAESFRIAQVQFELGTTNSVIYLTAKNKLENVQNQLLVKRYEWILQEYINNFYAGKLDL